MKLDEFNLVAWSYLQPRTQDLKPTPGAAPCVGKTLACEVELLEPNCFLAARTVR